MGKLAKFTAAMLLGVTMGTGAAQAADELAPEKLHVETIPAGPRDHWIWMGDVNPMSNADTREMLYDADKGKMLGMLSTGYWGSVILLPKSTGDIVSLETYFEHGTRGKRHDFVVVYDPETLKPLHEIEIPPRRMTALIQTGSTGYVKPSE